METIKLSEDDYRKMLVEIGALKAELAKLLLENGLEQQKVAKLRKTLQDIAGYCDCTEEVCDCAVDMKYIAKSTLDGRE